jgi:hypothetical protein
MQVLPMPCKRNAGETTNLSKWLMDHYGSDSDCTVIFPCNVVVRRVMVWCPSVSNKAEKIRFWIVSRKCTQHKLSLSNNDVLLSVKSWLTVEFCDDRHADKKYFGGKKKQLLSTLLMPSTTRSILKNEWTDREASCRSQRFYSKSSTLHLPRWIGVQHLNWTTRSTGWQGSNKTWCVR